MKLSEIVLAAIVTTLTIAALVVGLLYAVVGRLSMVLAIPPGNASPVWPPSA